MRMGLLDRSALVSGCASCQAAVEQSAALGTLSSEGVIDARGRAFM